MLILGHKQKKKVRLWILICIVFAFMIFACIRFGYSENSDLVFNIIKMITIVFCFPWPLTLLPTAMSLAGFEHLPKGEPKYKKYFYLIGWLLVLIYPIVFIKFILFCEQYLSSINYIFAALMSTIPIWLSLYFIFIFLRLGRKKSIR